MNNFYVWGFCETCNNKQPILAEKINTNNYKTKESKAICDKCEGLITKFTRELNEEEKSQIRNNMN